MQILQVNNLQAFNNFCFNKKNNAIEQKFGLKMTAPLSKDTISFKAKTCIADALVQQANKEMVRLNRISTIYLDNLFAVANKLEPLGVSFSRNYCEKNAVKTPESYVSKVKRSGSLVVPDRIRATLFSKNIDDLSVFNEILSTLSERELVPATVPGNLDEMILKGYTPTISEVSGKSPVMVKDIDIRLANVKNSIDGYSEYMYSQSGPQKSGYEDIQMRLVRQYERKENPVLFELIILPGKDYAFAKHLESEYIYSPVMKVFQELNVVNKAKSKNEDYNIINRSFGTIKNILVKEVSQKLFSNAEIIDKSLTKELSEVNIKTEDIKQIEDCLSMIKRSIFSYYTRIFKRTDLCEATKNRIAKAFEEDKDAYNKLKKNIDKAIKFFNEKDYLERKKDFWPEMFGEEFKAN